MGNPAGEAKDAVLRLDFDRRLMLQFHGSVVTSDAGLLPYRELDDVLGLTAMASDVLADARTGKNGRHALAGLFRHYDAVEKRPSTSSAMGAMSRSRWPRSPFREICSPTSCG